MSPLKIVGFLRPQNTCNAIQEYDYTTVSYLLSGMPNSWIVLSKLADTQTIVCLTLIKQHHNSIIIVMFPEHTR